MADYVLEQRLDYRKRNNRPWFAGTIALLFRGIGTTWIEESHAGVRLLAEDERSLRRLVNRIHAYLPGVFITSPVAVRYRGTYPDLDEPVMAISVVVPQSFDHDVRRILALRRAQYIGASFRSTYRVIYAQAPLSVALGMDEEVEALTDGLGLVGMRLSHYRPAELEQCPPVAPVRRA